MSDGMMQRMRGLGRVVGGMAFAAAVTAAFAAAPPASGGAAQPAPPKRLGMAPANEAELVRLPDGTLACFFTDMAAQQMKVIRSGDGGVSWSEPAVAFETGRTHHACEVLLDRRGQLHAFYLDKRGKGRPAEGYFIDVLHRRQLEGGAWSEPHRAYHDGYTGALRGVAELESGRIVLPIGAWKKPGEEVAPSTGKNYVTASCSDDAGRTWTLSPAKLTAPIHEGYNGSNYGAVEPTVLELRDGRLWMLIRTQTGYLYQAFSRDGVQWTEAEPTRFHSSSSPAELLRLRDGRIVLIWNNCAMPPRVDGQGVYGGRDAVHAAISDDEGQTWRGFREVYRDPTRNQDPPKRGDRGTAYPNAVQTEAGDIVLVTGQGEHARVMLRLDPAWLEATHRQDRFEQGLDGWSVFKGVGPASGWWRAREQGAHLIEHPDKPGAKVLHLRRPTTDAPDGAVWNFPAGRRGRVALDVRVQPGFGGGAIALTDRFFNPSDPQGEWQAMYHLPIAADGRLGEQGPVLTAGRWYALTLAWDLDAGRCDVLLDGEPALSLPLQNDAPNGISYLRLRSTAQAVDPHGWLVEAVSADVSSDSGATARR